ncbi:OmpA family protein [Flavobacterium sp.]|uniref:OmpA family protein n=1 Tax=Flavobacterium sp. TaxID=239 RepID=UPI0037500643
MRKLYSTIIVLLVVSNAIAQNKKEFQIKFETASHIILENESQKILDKVASLSKSKDNYYVQIIGHTDNIGNLDYNYTLSNERAKSVADFFIANGFLEKDIYLSGKSFLNPISENKSEKGKAKNRRVTIIISQKKQQEIRFAGLKLKEQTYTIDNSKTEVLDYKSGTKITIPENSFMDKNGNTVTGTVSIKYLEYREPTDYILANIPMDFHDGKENFYFNSGGMFKINAIKDGEEVFLKNGKNINLDFKITQELPNLNFYQLDSKNKWVELSKLNTTSNFGGYDVIEGEDIYTMNYYNLCNSTSCDSFNDIRNFGIKNSETENSLSKFYNFSAEKLKPKTEEKATNTATEKEKKSRKEEIIKSYKKGIENNLVRIEAFKNRITNETPKYSLKKIADENSELLFNINFEVITNVQNLNFKKINWSTNNTSQIAENDWNKKWNSCVITLNENETFTIVLKDSVNELSINANKMISDKINLNKPALLSEKMNKGFEIQLKKISKYEKINEKYAKRNSDFEKKIADLTSNLSQKKQTDSIKIYTNKNFVKCFWENSKSYMTAEEQNLTLIDWISYFDINKSLMNERYKNLQNSSDCIELYKKREEANRLAYENQKQSAVAILKANQLTRSLSITNLGIYNCDQIQRLQNPIEIFAEYKDENAKEIKPLFIYLLDSKFNGIIKYDGYNNYSPYRFAYSPSSKNTILAFDGNGDSYIFESEKFKNINTSEKNLKYNFTMTKIDNLKDDIDLKKLL